LFNLINTKKAFEKLYMFYFETFRIILNPSSVKNNFGQYACLNRVHLVDSPMQWRQICGFHLDVKFSWTSYTQGLIVKRFILQAALWPWEWQLDRA